MVESIPLFSFLPPSGILDVFLSGFCDSCLSYLRQFRNQPDFLREFGDAYAPTAATAGTEDGF
jgi:hypothetical protein